MRIFDTIRDEFECHHYHSPARVVVVDELPLGLTADAFHMFGLAFARLAVVGAGLAHCHALLVVVLLLVALALRSLLE